MSYDINDILREYKLKQTDALERARQKKEEIYSTIPEMKELDREMSSIGLKIAREAIESSDIDMNDLRIRIGKLNSRKNRLLVQYGYSPEDLTVQYECSKCSDTGYTPDGKKCECFEKAITEKLYEDFGMSRILKEQNFSTFNLDVFSDVVDPKENLSPRQNMSLNCATAEVFCHNKGKNAIQNLIMFGSTGLGKTFLCNCIAKYFIEKEESVVYRTAIQLFDIVSERRFGSDENGRVSAEARERYNTLLNCYLLIIDDLGTELTNSHTIVELFNIINTRIINGKRTVISTNLTPKALADRYTDRIFSRITSDYEHLFFFGNDLRWQKKRERGGPIDSNSGNI